MGGIFTVSCSASRPDRSIRLDAPIAEDRRESRCPHRRPRGFVRPYLLRDLDARRGNTVGEDRHAVVEDRGVNELELRRGALRDQHVVAGVAGQMRVRSRSQVWGWSCCVGTDVAATRRPIAWSGRLDAMPRGLALGRREVGCLFGILRCHELRGDGAAVEPDLLAADRVVLEVPDVEHPIVAANTAQRGTGATDHSDL